MQFETMIKARVPQTSKGSAERAILWQAATVAPWDKPKAHAQPHPTPTTTDHRARKIIRHSQNEPITPGNASIAKFRVTSDLETLIELRDNDAAIRSWAIAELHKAGVANPLVAQIATQYNSERQKGLISKYGRQVFWIYKELKAGRILGDK